MRIFIIIISFIFIQNCSKPKTVLICGDHVCINKAEAEQYFEENLSIEVQIIDNKKKKEIDLVELNLKNDSNKKKMIMVQNKNNTSKKIRVLSKDEKQLLRKKIKKTKKLANIKKDNHNSLKKDKKSTTKKVEKNKLRKNVIKPKPKVVDVCTIVEKCNINEISKFLLKQAKKKSFPDITTRE